MKKILLLLSILILFIGCATIERPQLKTYNHKQDFINVVSENITYDPYADQLYIDSVPAITRAYRTMLKNTIQDTIQGTEIGLNHTYYSQMRSYFYGYAYNDGKRPPQLINSITYFYGPSFSGTFGASLSEQMGYDKAGSSFYNNWSLEDFKRKYYYGWNIKKSGPAKSLEGFQYYEIPMTITYFVGFVGDSSRVKRYKIDFIHKQGEAVTLEADAEKTDAGETIKIEEAPVESDVYEDLRKLNELFESGIITEEEYNEKKAILLERI